MVGRDRVRGRVTATHAGPGAMPWLIGRAVTPLFSALHESCHGGPEMSCGTDIGVAMNVRKCGKVFTCSLPYSIKVIKEWCKWPTAGQFKQIKFTKNSEWLQFTKTWFIQNLLVKFPKIFIRLAS